MSRDERAKSPGIGSASREEIENFLYMEAALLDEWRLEEWLELFTADGRYVVPSTDLPKGDPESTLCLINDDMVRLRGRVERLKGRHAFREFPFSRTRRLITNVRVTAAEGDEISVTASFLVYRMRNRQVDPYVGQYHYTLVRDSGRFKIRVRRAELDLEVLSPHGTVSIIL